MDLREKSVLNEDVKTFPRMNVRTTGFYRPTLSGFAPLQSWSLQDSDVEQAPAAQLEHRLHVAQFLWGARGYVSP